MPNPSAPLLSNRKQSIAQNFAKAVNYNQHASVQSQVCDLLITKIINHHQSSILEIGAGQGQLTERLKKILTANNWHINELCEEHRQTLQNILPVAQIHIGDGEQLFLPTKHSLIISANAIQWFDYPINFIKSSANQIAKGGQLLFNTFTPNNFMQIKQLTGQGLDYPSTQQWKSALEKYHFDIKSIEIHKYELLFDSPKDVLKHIKKTGVSVNNNKSEPQNNFRWSKSSLKNFIKNYQTDFSNNDGKVILSYEVLLISAIKTI